MTEFYDAASSGNLERVKLLVEQGTEKNKMYNIRGSRYGNEDDYETALAVAAENDHLHIVRYLVDQGADMEMADGHGWTPLMAASFNGHVEVVRCLLEQGANRDKANNGGYTSLHWAANKGHLEIAKLLMVYGADLNARTNYGRLPIDMEWNNTEEIKQAIRDEPRRRMDEAPGKRATEQDRHPNAAASAQQENEDKDDQTNLQPGKGGEENDIVADEDQDSEPSDDEDDH